MSLLHINLQDALLAENELAQTRFVSARRLRHLRNHELRKLIISRDELKQLDYPEDTDLKEALRILGIQDSIREDVSEDKLPADRIVHIQAIRTICMNYGLVFRPFRDYNGQLPKEVAIEVLTLKGILGHDPDPCRFFIAAPNEMFCDSLNPNDPFLFYEIGADEYFLVHQWGLDTSPLRLIMHWPRGTRTRLFATRTLLAVIAIGCLAAGGALWESVRPWMFAGAIGVAAYWFKSVLDYRCKRGGHEKRWFQP